jgi:hypothetical protein
MKSGELGKDQPRDNGVDLERRFSGLSISDLQQRVYKLVTGIIEPCNEAPRHRHVSDAREITAVSLKGIDWQIGIEGNQRLREMSIRYRRFLQVRHPDWGYEPGDPLGGNLALLGRAEGIRDLIDILDKYVPRWFEEDIARKDKPR